MTMCDKLKEEAHKDMKFEVGQRVLFMTRDDGLIPYLSYGEVVKPKFEDLITVDFNEVGVWHCGPQELEPMKYDLKAIGFDPNEPRIDYAFHWPSTPEGYGYWMTFGNGYMTKEDAEVAQAKWDAMKKQWYEEQAQDDHLDWEDTESSDITSFGADLVQSLKETAELEESLLVDTPEQHYTPKDIQPVDNVKHPNHYNQDGEIECIDAIKASLGTDGFAAYCKGNCMKYLWRYKYKNGVEDLEKAKVYLEWMIETVRKGD